MNKNWSKNLSTVVWMPYLSTVIQCKTFFMDQKKTTYARQFRMNPHRWKNVWRSLAGNYDNSCICSRRKEKTMYFISFSIWLNLTVFSAMSICLVTVRFGESVRKTWWRFQKRKFFTKHICYQTNASPIPRFKSDASRDASDASRDASLSVGLCCYFCLIISRLTLADIKWFKPHFQNKCDLPPPSYLSPLVQTLQNNKK